MLSFAAVDSETIIPSLQMKIAVPAPKLTYPIQDTFPKIQKSNFININYVFVNI